MNIEETKMVFETIEETLGEQIGYHTSFDLPPKWTEDYREGYVDGLKQALTVLTEIYGG